MLGTGGRPAAEHRSAQASSQRLQPEQSLASTRIIGKSPRYAAELVRVRF
jgi:hypothetical protein